MSLFVSRTNLAINFSLCVEVFLANGVEFLLIQDPLIPKVVGLCIKLCLKMAHQHRLYLTGILLTVVESKEFQQVHLGRIQCGSFHINSVYDCKYIQYF